MIVKFDNGGRSLYIFKKGDINFDRTATCLCNTPVREIPRPSSYEV